MKLIANNLIKVYKGYYKSKLIALSLNKELLDIYFQINRKTKDYTIEKDRISTSELLSEEYDNLLLDEFYNTYLPKIDILMIEFYEKQINFLPNETLTALINLISLLNDGKKYSKDIEVLLQASLVCRKIDDDEKLKYKLQKKAYKNSPLTYMDIEKYLVQRKSFMQFYDAKQKMDNGYFN